MAKKERLKNNELLKKAMKNNETLCLSCSVLIPKGGLKNHAATKGHKNNVKKISDERMARIKKQELKENEKREKAFLRFASEFAKKASIISAGDKFPSVYISNDNNGFRIDYLKEIRDRRTKNLIKTPARISRTTGIIEVSKSSFLKYTEPMRTKMLTTLYFNNASKESLKDVFEERGKKFRGLKINNDILKNGKGSKQNKSCKIHIKRKPKKAATNKIRKGKANAVGKKNRKK